MASLQLIDKLPMLDHFQLESLDKIFLLAGDLHQCLPLVPGANRAGIVDHSINQSHLWQQFQVLRLTENIRVRASGDPELEAFDQWTLAIGNGSVVNEAVPIPAQMVT